MTSNIEIEYAEQVIIDCAQDLQEECGFPNTKDSKFWRHLRGYSNWSDARNTIKRWARIVELVEKGFDLANKKREEEEDRGQTY